MLAIGEDQFGNVAIGSGETREERADQLAFDGGEAARVFRPGGGAHDPPLYVLGKERHEMGGIAVAQPLEGLGDEGAVGFGGVGHGISLRQCDRRGG